MREIKFRAWDKENQSMVSHDLMDQYDRDGIAHWMDIIKPNNKEGFVVMQFTGLLDENETEIYDGDIVMCYIDGETGILTVSFHCDRDFAGWNITPEQAEEGKVIGNIHQNPELT